MATVANTGNINFPKNSQGRYITDFFPDWTTLDQLSRYDWLTKFYDANNLYTEICKLAYYQDEYLEPIKGLFTPAHRSVEFFASKLCQGSPRITAKNQSIVEPINQFLDWSNFDSQKTVAIRKDAMLGNLFKKVVVSGGKVYEEILEAEYVTSFTKDARGFLLTFRMDIPDGNKWITEYWTCDPEDGQPYYASWNNSFGPSAKLSQLGNPNEFIFLSQWGIDFVPIVHIQFRNVGKQYGMAAVEHCVDKIHELNRHGTILHQRMFRDNKETMVITSMIDGKGMKLTPKVSAEEKEGIRYYMIDGGGMDTKDSKINFAVHLDVLKHYEEELTKDLPELKYYNQDLSSNLSGEALSKLLAGAIDRGTEAQKNFVTEQVKLNQMALTLGRNAGLFKFNGEFDNGDLMHTMEFAEILPSNSLKDKAAILATLPVDIPLPLRMSLSGYSQEEIDSVSTVASQPTQA
jgi:hypothetical protein